MSDQVTVLVGTTKGVFLLRGNADRTDFDVSGPHCDGWPINHVIADPKTGTIWAAGGSEWHGAGVWRSDDDGATWTLSSLSQGQMNDWLRNDPGFAQMIGAEPQPDGPFQGQIMNLWSLMYAGETLYTGAKPATLFASKDRGTTWEKVEGLSNHPSSDSWQPGGAGLTLHTIFADPKNPKKLWCGISAAGVFASEDGGETWERRNRLSNAEAAHDHKHHEHDVGACGHEIGHCVHNMVRASGDDGDLLYQQNHHGVFRSNDGGRSWDAITEGLPSDFGFPIAVHPHDPQTVWVLPLNGDTQGRFPPNASAAVYRSRNGGAEWSAMTDGLPTKNCFFTVLRQGMATDKQQPAGVYFGTNSGSIFATNNEGDTWSEIARHLPTVTCVETLERG